MIKGHFACGIELVCGDRPTGNQAVVILTAWYENKPRFEGHIAIGLEGCWLGIEKV